MTIADNIHHIRADIQTIALHSGRDPSSINLVVVTKNQAPSEILQAYETGCTSLAENRVQDALIKIPLLPPDINWHFIGTLQKNKISKIIGRFVLIHSVDTPELAKEINLISSKAGVVTNILLQANTSGESAKHGLSPDEWLKRFQEVAELPNVKINGWMTIAAQTENEDVIRSSFRRLRELRDATGLEHLSMGMSNDYRIAIEEGATLLRIGSAIFEEVSC
jgi:pyridoxal phosphate enzyme (YggS family)